LFNFKLAKFVSKTTQKLFLQKWQCAAQAAVTVRRDNDKRAKQDERTKFF